jgi:hypothetical protein
MIEDEPPRPVPESAIGPLTDLRLRGTVSGPNEAVGGVVSPRLVRLNPVTNRHSGGRMRDLCLGVLGLLLGVPAVGWAGPVSYTFVNIADSSGPINAFLEGPAMNNSGTLTFVAFLDTAGGSTIFAGSGAGPLTPIASTGDLFNVFSLLPAINDGGTVAFMSLLAGGDAGIFTGRGGPLTTVVDTSGAFSDLGDPSINDAGRVAFWAALDAGGQGVFSITGTHDHREWPHQPLRVQPVNQQRRHRGVPGRNREGD